MSKTSEIIVITSDGEIVEEDHPQYARLNPGGWVYSSETNNLYQLDNYMKYVSFDKKNTPDNVKAILMLKGHYL